VGLFIDRHFSHVETASPSGNSECHAAQRARSKKAAIPSSRTRGLLRSARIAARTIAGAAVLALLSGCVETESNAKVQALQLEDVAAYWAVRGKDQEQNNYIHPVVRFRIKNGFPEEVSYIQAMAVFKRENFPDEPWGSAFLHSISDQPLPAGGASEVLVLRADTNFVSKDSPEQMFQNEKWEQVLVQIFLRVGPSVWTPVVALEVPKHIGAPGLEKFLEPAVETSTPPP
jgi:hypothetical protein